MINECYSHRLLHVADEKNIRRDCFFSEDRWAVLSNHIPNFDAVVLFVFCFNVERMILQRGAFVTLIFSSLLN